MTTEHKAPLPDYVLESCASFGILPEDIKQYTLRLPDSASDDYLTLRIMTRSGQIYSRLIPINPPSPADGRGAGGEGTDQPARPPRKTPSHTRKG